MAKKQQMNCVCGAAYDSSGVCTRCGKKRPRSGGYRFLHSLLCAIGILIIWFCFCNTTALRSYSASTALTDALRSARLSDAAIPFSGKNVTEYIRRSYVTDENVLPEDVAAAADGMGIPAFLAGKLDAHFALLRGESDTPVRIAPEEITGLLDQIADSLHESCKLVIDESDRQQLRDTAEPVLNKINALSDAFGSNPAGRAFQRFGVSIWAYIPEIVLLILLIWRWCAVRKNSGKDIAGAFKGTGITIMIPAALSLILVLLGGIRTLFIRDGVIGLYGVTKVLRAPYWFIAVTGVSFALFMLELAAFIRARKQLKEAAPAAPAAKSSGMQDAPVVPVYLTACVKCGKELDSSSKFCKYCGARQDAPAPAPAPETAAAQPVSAAPAAPAASAPAEKAAGGKMCVCCGKELAANMKFCKYCGTNQETGENIVDAVLNGTAGFPEPPEDGSGNE